MERNERREDGEIKEILDDYVNEEMNILRLDDVPKDLAQNKKERLEKLMEMRRSRKAEEKSEEDREPEEKIEEIREPKETSEEEITGKVVPLRRRRVRFPLVASIAVVVLAVGIVGGVSAAAFRVDPLGVVMKYFEKEDMRDVRYGKREGEEIKENSTEKMVPVSDMPTYVPEGWGLSVSDVESDEVKFVEWTMDEGKKEATIRYERFERSKEDQRTRYAVFDKAGKEKGTIKIKNYRTQREINGEEEKITWMDEKYIYEIVFDLKNVSEKEITTMAESIYE